MARPLPDAHDGDGGEEEEQPQQQPRGSIDRNSIGGSSSSNSSRRHSQSRRSTSRVRRGSSHDDDHAHLDPSHGAGGVEMAAVVAEEPTIEEEDGVTTPVSADGGQEQSPAAPEPSPQINSRGPVRLVDPDVDDHHGHGGTPIGRSPTPHRLLAKKKFNRRCVRTVRVLGIILVVVGVLALVVAMLSHTLLPSLRDKKVLQALIVDSKDTAGYEAWVATAEDSDSPLLVTYYFYTLLNPGDFVKGVRPMYQEMGPYVFKQRSQKVDVVFSEDGELVSYVSLSQNDFQPELSDGKLSDSVTLFNLPYATAVATVGSETNLLRVGARGALKEMRRALLEEFLPTMKENAAVYAATKAIKLMQDALAKVYYPEDGVAIRWGGGCVQFQGWLNHCGFSSLTYLKAVLDKEQADDLELWQLCLETDIDDNPGRVLPLPTIKALWNTSDPLAIFNTDRLNTSVRYGVSRWLRNDPDSRDAIMMRFKINDYQYNKLQAYISRIYNSEILEQFVLKTFRKALVAEDAERAAGEILGWEDLVWRQWTVGDVVQILNGYAKPASLLEDNPPELAWYMNDALGVPAWNYNASKAYRWSNYQARCFFNASLSSGDYFQETILGLPPVFNKSPRTPFNRPDLLTLPLMRPIEKCMVSQDAWAVMRGYIDHVAQNFVRPVLEEKVIRANGGLIVTRSVGSWLGGREEPILALSLEPDDPRITFSLMGHDAKLSGPGVCAMSNDVENPFTACKLSKTKEGKTIYYKTANTYHTGKRHPERIGAMALYRGEETLWGVWPKTTIPILGGAQSTGSHIQYGFSEGLQFPPFNRIIRSSDGPDPAAAAAAAAVNETEAEAALTALKNAFNTAKNGIMALSVDDGNSSSSSTAAAGGGIATMSDNGGNEDAWTAFALAYLAADAATAGAATTTTTTITGPEGEGAGAAAGEKEDGDLGEDRDDIAVWLGKFTIPLRFRFKRPVMVRGIRLRRFDLSPATYNPKRRDAKAFSMDGPEARAGLLNVTDLQTLPMFLSPPQFFGLPELRQLDCLRSIKLTERGMLEAAEGSYISIEPYTGRAMQAHMAMQISTSTAAEGAPKFDVWYPNVYKAEVIPTLWMSQGAEVGEQDAALFNSVVYKSDEILKAIQSASVLGGLGATGLGLLFILIVCMVARPKCCRKKAAHERSPSAAEEGRYYDSDEDDEYYEEEEEEEERQREVEMARVRTKRNSRAQAARAV